MTEGSASANDLDAVERVRLYLEEHGYGGKITVTDKTIFTVKDAADAIGVEEEHLKELVAFGRRLSNARLAFRLESFELSEGEEVVERQARPHGSAGLRL